MFYRKHLIVLLLLSPLAVFAQDITGLWKGTLYNDTTKQYYSYEVGISQEKGKLSGFSHTWFIFEDKQYFGVKKVTVKKAADGKIIIEDDGLISNNYPVSPSKNVRQLNVLTLNAKDSVMTLEGPFTTNRTKEYHPLTGSIKLQRKNDFWQSALVPHLQELGQENKLSFVKEENDLLAFVEAKQDEAVFKQLEEQYKAQVKKEEAQTQKAVAKQTAESKAAEKKAAEDIEKAAALVKKQETAAAEKAARETAKLAAAQKELDKKSAEEKLRTEKALAKQEAIADKSTGNDLAKKEAANQRLAKQQAEDKIKTEKELAKREAANQQLAEKQAAAKLKADQELAKREAAAKELAEKQEQEKTLARQTTAPALKRSLPAAAPVNLAPAANVNLRKTVLQQTVYFTSDSLLLTLYDNGEVDGDTVSVLMNGELIIAKQGLSTTAAKKTIYIPSSTDRIELVMYAESLGSIPPNTGLLVIRDGKDLYEIRFSGDLQKNASIVFNRKKE
jgi:hypothetical protein